MHCYQFMYLAGVEFKGEWLESADEVEVRAIKAIRKVVLLVEC